MRSQRQAPSGPQDRIRMALVPQIVERLPTQVRAPAFSLLNRSVPSSTVRGVPHGTGRGTWRGPTTAGHRRRFGGPCRIVPCPTRLTSKPIFTVVCGIGVRPSSIGAPKYEGVVQNHAVQAGERRKCHHSRPGVGTVSLVSFVKKPNSAFFTRPGATSCTPDKGHSQQENERSLK